jgi:YARHG domain-containing protein
MLPAVFSGLVGLNQEILSMRLLSTIAAALAVAAAFAAPAADAQGSCHSLWVERNSYYKQAGYCFRTERAIAYFGNAGCYIYNEAQVRFSPGVWARILEIRRLEQAMGCPV